MNTPQSERQGTRQPNVGHQKEDSAAAESEAFKQPVDVDAIAEMADVEPDRIPVVGSLAAERVESVLVDHHGIVLVSVMLRSTVEVMPTKGGLRSGGWTGKQRLSAGRFTLRVESVKRKSFRRIKMERGS